MYFLNFGFFGGLGLCTPATPLGVPLFSRDYIKDLTWKGSAHNECSTQKMHPVFGIWPQRLESSIMPMWGPNLFNRITRKTLYKSIQSSANKIGLTKIDFGPLRCCVMAMILNITTETCILISTNVITSNLNSVYFQFLI
jgi:hypothetical protein